ncbi:MAG: helix-turn-helix domain-containing protein [archaeon]
MEDIRLLQKIGLTELEAQAYLTLLRKGRMSAGALAKSINVQRSTIYYLLDKLRGKGLIGESVQGKTNFVKATNPKILEQQAQETYNKVKEAIPKMIMNQDHDEDEVLVFKKYKGLKAAHEQMLVESKKGDEFLIFGSRAGEDISVKTYRNFYKNFNDRRVKKGITQKVVMNADLKDKIGNYYEKLAKTKVRYLDQYTPAPVVIYPTSVAIVHWKKDPSIIIIRGKGIRESFKQYFEGLWKQAKP